jgi:hypothetical protein
VRKSRFAGLAAALRKDDEAHAAESKKKIAKSQDKENYAQTTVYLARDMYGDLQKALTDDKQEYSQLVENLLREWFEKRKRSDV